MSTAQTNSKGKSAAAAGAKEKAEDGGSPRKSTRSKASPVVAKPTTAKATGTRQRKSAASAGQDAQRADELAQRQDEPARRQGDALQGAVDAAAGQDGEAAVVRKHITLQDGAVVNTEHWHRLVAEAAYFRAQRRGFENGSPEQDWLEAEEEIRRLHQDRGAEGRNA